ncbi:hypothetical protein IW262DRAFT_172957 [Armillaria fumosa]|nr:hypothetical protein IW262DRAFT_172957 [Armillaria fumosa]
MYPSWLDNVSQCNSQAYFRKPVNSTSRNSRVWSCLRVLTPTARQHFLHQEIITMTSPLDPMQYSYHDNSAVTDGAPYTYRTAAAYYRHSEIVQKLLPLNTILQLDVVLFPAGTFSIMQPISISFFTIALGLAAASAMPAMENNGIAARVATPDKTGSGSSSTGDTKLGPGGDSDMNMESSQTTLTCTCKPKNVMYGGGGGLPVDPTPMRRGAKGSTSPSDSPSTLEGGGKGAEGGEQKYTCECQPGSGLDSETPLGDESGGDESLGGDSSSLGGDPSSFGGDSSSLGGDSSSIGNDPSSDGLDSTSTDEEEPMDDEEM